ncbi:RNA 2',3'-cyclic phosphodiesterase [Marinobacter sp. ATCH36]|uniref:RNA 2',3'-cyclic phosphodiesterase n=1 Tax=Marinobacter sp. ATCH36 TaxID=2945106 RepID=UPI0020213D64|nr:RNA 2',3'-cyclic phosphodiesterase [Marinobacter sp. ATCH36]MCL7944191.1 RNA 2',3'-cyclic phosphodiesterase [Marinobacter sp. ATCH36]
MDKPVKHRLFFGLDLPESVKQQLLSIQRPLAGARWQRADQLHLTLAFLGSVEEQHLPVLREVVRNLPVLPFDLAISGVGCFGKPDRPKNLWAGVRPVQKLEELQAGLNQRLASVGFAQEKRSFQPHVTLCRFKKEAGSVAELLQDYDELLIEPFQVDRFALFESVQGERGSVYHVVETYPLSGAR